MISNQIYFNVKLWLTWKYRLHLVNQTTTHHLRSILKLNFTALGRTFTQMGMMNEYNYLVNFNLFKWTYILAVDVHPWQSESHMRLHSFSCCSTYFKGISTWKCFEENFNWLFALPCNIWCGIVPSELSNSKLVLNITTNPI